MNYRGAWRRPCNSPKSLGGAWAPEPPLFRHHCGCKSFRSGDWGRYEGKASCESALIYHQSQYLKITWHSIQVENNIPKGENISRHWRKSVIRDVYQSIKPGPQSGQYNTIREEREQWKGVNDGWPRWLVRVYRREGVPKPILVTVRGICICANIHTHTHIPTQEPAGAQKQ